VERDPRLKLSIELTRDEAQVLLVYLERLLPYDAGPASREDDRMFNRATKRLCATLEKELAKMPRKDRPVSSITQFDGLACAANEGRRVDFALPRAAKGSRRARAGQGQGLRLALSRHPVTAAARDGARVERLGRGNGSAGTERENVGKEVRRAPRLAQASFPLPVPARCRECRKRNWEFSAASG
jgi:hypothetical protein